MASAARQPNEPFGIRSFREAQSSPDHPPTALEVLSMEVAPVSETRKTATVSLTDNYGLLLSGCSQVLAIVK